MRAQILVRHPSDCCDVLRHRRQLVGALSRFIWDRRVLPTKTITICARVNDIVCTEYELISSPDDREEKELLDRMMMLAWSIRIFRSLLCIRRLPTSRGCIHTRDTYPTGHKKENTHPLHRQVYVPACLSLHVSPIKDPPSCSILYTYPTLL